MKPRVTINASALGRPWRLVGIIVIVLGLVLGSISAQASRRVERSINVDGLTREYVVWVPDGAQGRALPVVLAFHGGGGNLEGLERSANLHNAAEARNYLIVYAAGYDKTWNVGGYCCGGAARQNINDVKFVRELLNDLGSVANYDHRRVYATGFSNGGQFSYYLACNLSDQIAAVASVSGAMQPPFDRCHPTRPVPVMHWAGLADRFDPFQGGISAIKTAPPQPPVMQGIETWRRLNGVQTTRPVDIVGANAQCMESSGGSSRAVVVLCTVQDLGHQWPGRNQASARPRLDAILGPLGPAFDVNDAILTFFSHFSLP